MAWEQRLTAVGSLEAVQGVTVSAETGGRVSRIAFESGATVSAGDVLIQLDTASEEAQLRYYDELDDWATQTNTTVFFFEAFDEPWKGNPNNPMCAEKHWGLFFVDRSPKLVMQR